MKTKLLRSLGIAGLAGSAILFLLKGLTVSTPAEMLMQFLGIEVVLGIVGVWLAHRLQDHAGARTFLGLALALLPALFASLGNSILSGDGQAGLVAGIAVVVLGAALSWLGFLVFDRRTALETASVYFVSNLVLLIPSREAIATAVLAAFVGVLAWVLRPRSNETTASVTLSRLGLLSPAIIILGRGLWHAQPIWLFALAFALVGFCLIAIMEHAASLGQFREVLTLAGRVSLPFGLILGAVSLAVEVPHTVWSLARDHSWLILAVVGIAALILATLSTRRESRGRGQGAS